MTDAELLAFGYKVFDLALVLENRYYRTLRNQFDDLKIATYKDLESMRRDLMVEFARDVLALVKE